MPFDPFSQLAGQAIKVGTDIWTAIMLSVWNVGLLLTRFVLRLEEHFLTPDLTESGPARDLYATTFWIAASLLVIMIMVQLGVAALRRDGKSLGRLLLGVGQFVVVWAAWLTYAAAVIAACSGLNAALMRTMFATDSLAGWDPLGGFEVGDVTEVVTAGVLGLLGVLLCVAAIAHFVVLLTRAGALVVLAATTPISAAGLVGDTGRAWFWKSLRWFHAAAFTPVVMTLIMGVGVQMASGVAGGQADKTNEAIGTALPAVVLMLISAVSPARAVQAARVRRPRHQLRRVAADEPGRARRHVRPLRRAAGGGDAGTATQTAASGRSQGEAQGEDATSRRFAAGQASPAGSAGAGGTASGGAGTASAAQAPDSRAPRRAWQVSRVWPGWRWRPESAGSRRSAVRRPRSPPTPPTRWGSGTTPTSPTSPVAGHRGSQNGHVGDADPGGQPATDQPGPPDSSGGMPQPPIPDSPPAPFTPGDPGNATAPAAQAAGSPAAEPAAAGSRVGRVQRVGLVRRRPPPPPGGRRGGHVAEGSSEGVTLMSVNTYTDYSRDRIGWFFGLSGPQLAILAVASLPVFWALQQQAWWPPAGVCGCVRVRVPGHGGVDPGTLRGGLVVGVRLPPVRRPHRCQTFHRPGRARSGGQSGRCRPAGGVAGGAGPRRAAGRARAVPDRDHPEPRRPHVGGHRRGRPPRHRDERRGGTQPAGRRVDVACSTWRRAGS